MKAIFAGAAAAALVASAAIAADGEVTVSIGPQLQDRAGEYGQSELNWLAEDLERTVERQIARTGNVASADLVIVDARPNRPTMQQMRRTPGLSLQSFGIGGATVEGTVTTTDGATHEVRYRWYENDIRQARGAWTWSDAHWTFDRLARRIANGDQLASR